MRSVTAMSARQKQLKPDARPQHAGQIFSASIRIKSIGHSMASQDSVAQLLVLVLGWLVTCRLRSSSTICIMQ